MKVLIVGLGVIGASFAKGLIDKGYTIYGVDTDINTIDYAVKNNIICEGSTNINDYAQIADLVILCVYPKAIIEILKTYKFRDDAIITDVSGVKEKLIEEVDNLNLKSTYVSIHPMAGREKRGILYSDKNRFIDANFLIIPSKNSTKESIDLMRQIAKDLDFGTITEMSGKYHDHMIAKTSQLPHALAVALVVADEDTDTLKYIGDSYRDLTRIAMINENLWLELFYENKDNLVDNINKFEEKLEFIKKCLLENKEEDLREMFIKSTSKRELMNK